jgi:hypothetical protein
MDARGLTMEPIRNVWVSPAAWFRHQDATVVLVSPEQSADLPAYYAEHTESVHDTTQLPLRY